MVMTVHPAAAISGVKSSSVECWLFLFTRSCGAEQHRKIGFDTIKTQREGVFEREREGKREMSGEK